MAANKIVATIIVQGKGMIMVIKSHTLRYKLIDSGNQEKIPSPTTKHNWLPYLY